MRKVKNFSFVEGDYKIYVMERLVGLEVYRHEETFHLSETEHQRTKVAYRIQSVRRMIQRTLAQYKVGHKPGEAIKQYLARMRYEEARNAGTARGMRSSYKHNRRNM